MVWLADEERQVNVKRQRSEGVIAWKGLMAQEIIVRYHYTQVHA